MNIVARLDDIGKPAWIALMVLGFIFFWPVGLAILAFLYWSGRMGCWKGMGFSDLRRARGRWHAPWSGSGNGAAWQRGGSSGNSAFDEYRNETLRRLEEEQGEFQEFLARLRQAKDKAEFDEFMAERRRRQQAGPDSSEPRS